MLIKPTHARPACIDLYGNEVSSPVAAPAGVYQRLEFGITSWLVDRQMADGFKNDRLNADVIVKGFDPWFGSPDVIAVEVGEFARAHGLQINDTIETLVHAGWRSVGEALFAGRFNELQATDLGYNAVDDSPTAPPWEFMRNSERTLAEAKAFDVGWLDASKQLGLSVEESLKIENEVYGAMDRGVGAVMPDVIREAIAQGILDKVQ
jgi:hypothetical protein